MMRPNIAPLAVQPPRSESIGPESPRSGRNVPVDVRRQHAYQPTPGPIESDLIPPEARTDNVAEPTQIRISIGRVEVRAVTAPPAPEPPSRPGPSGPKLSLDDYLRARNEGRR
jgi:hypothetical protein